MVVENDHTSAQELESREPSLEDLVDLCRSLNQEKAKYVVIGGFAIRAAGYIRSTMDIDLLIATGEENETRVFNALKSLPDQAVSELVPGEVAQYAVVRVADEIVVDLMKSACGIDYEQAVESIVTHEIDGVVIPFASPELLWRTKCSTHREKDRLDLFFLAQLFEQNGTTPP